MMKTSLKKEPPTLPGRLEEFDSYGSRVELIRREPLKLRERRLSMTLAHSQAHTTRVCRYHIVWIPKCCRKGSLATCASRRSINRSEWFASRATGLADGQWLQQCAPLVSKCSESHCRCSIELVPLSNLSSDQITGSNSGCRTVYAAATTGPGRCSPWPWR